MRLPFRFFSFTSLMIAASLPLSSVLAQEAVETPRPEATPEQSPTKSARDKNPDQSKPGRSLEETMRPEEFKAAGLDKLNEDELQHLDAYLQGYRQAAQKKAAEQAQVKAQDEIKKANAKADEANAKANEAQKATEEAKRDAANARTKLDSLVSRVDGSIEGIKGHTVIRLEDGTIWKQVNVDDHYRASVTDHPTAVVLHTPFGYKMRIEGMPEFYVDPVVRSQ
jgi:high-affinity Fe2+/Pb2+ permease